MTGTGSQAVAVSQLRSALIGWSRRSGWVPPTSEHPIAVAFSGGLDSTALLAVALQVWPGAVHALHVNHGLQAAADGFERHCRRTCTDWDVPLTVMAVSVVRHRGDSVEEQARTARYAALADAARSVEATGVLLAQHADDQAETLLLALTRGAGVAGLAGMGDSSLRGGVAFARPWLQLRQHALREAAVAHGWSFVDDPTNGDVRYTRNRIRHGLLPELSKSFPAAVDVMSRTARHCAEATVLLDEMAREDAMRIGSPPRIQALQALSSARQANVLRFWLVGEFGRSPSTAQLDELRKQLAAATTRGHRIRIRVASGWVVRTGEVLSCERTP